MTDIDKATLLERIKNDRARLDALITPLDERRLTEAALDDGWSVKDVLAHISAWERLCLGWIRDDTRLEGPFTVDTLNKLNARIYEENRALSLSDILDASKRSFAEIAEMVEQISPDRLAAAPAWAPGRPLSEIVGSNTDEHYREHIDQIEAWLRGRAS